MQIKSILRAVLSVSVFFTVVQASAQSSSLVSFWRSVDIKLVTNTMQGGIRSWIYQSAQQLSGNSYTGILARMENIQRDKQLQDQILLNLYIAYPNLEAKETMRFVLNSMCGSFNLANPVSNYVYSKYSHDRRALKAIANNDAAKRQQEEKQSEPLLDSTTVQPLLDTVNNSQPSPTQPIFKGELWRFIGRTVTYPDKAKEKGFQGKAVVAFTVETDGTIGNIAIQKSSGHSILDEEALRAVKETSGMWKPGTKEGIAVPMQTQTSVDFSLN